MSSATSACSTAPTSSWMVGSAGTYSARLWRQASSRSGVMLKARTFGGWLPCRASRPRVRRLKPGAGPTLRLDVRGCEKGGAAGFPVVLCRQLPKAV